MNIALRNVADHLLNLNHDSSSRIPPISKTASNEFYVKTNCYFSLAVLDSTLKSEFSAREINIDFDYSILKAENNVLLLGNSISFLVDTIPILLSDSSVACLDRSDVEEKPNFKIRINNKTTYLINSMGIWMYSSLSLLVILAVFTFIMVSIIKGKKLSILKKDFVNNMTHELKTPIANISVASDAIRSGNVRMDEVKLKKYADIIYKENVRLHHLVDAVLQISAIEKEEESLSFEEVDLHQVIKEVLLSFEPMMHERSGSFNSALNASRYKVLGDRTHLSNVIYNLIENGIKYSKNSPEITIKTTNSKNGMNVEITDKGVGVSKENQKRIFEKFFRAESGDLHNTKGYGLGLSYVQLIIDKHKGLITFKSMENVGSTINIFLPI
ncbi:MAG: HAMP domain-containing histidine kinase, partial [Flavobacteriales bacterium]|nr:HAMP domain-containing histidine kinase [Flavobacteriales bacterium]